MVEILKDLPDIADPQHTALVVIDAQHDFVSQEGAMAKVLGLDMSAIEATIPQLNQLIDWCREAGVLVIYVREIFSDNKLLPNQKALWGSGDDIWLIREDGEGIEWDSRLVPPRPDEPVITKWQYDAFEDTDLDLLLRSRGIKTLLMCGFTANVCVETTLRHGYMKGYYIVLAEDCTNAPTKEEYESALFNVRTYFGKVAPSTDLAQMWGLIPQDEPGSSAQQPGEPVSSG